MGAAPVHIVTFPSPSKPTSRPRRVRFRLAVAIIAVAGASPAVPLQAQVLPTFGGDRAGTSGFQFLKVAVDPRGEALGHTVVANAADGSALFWNPALAAQAEGAHVALHHAGYFADVNVDYVAALAHLPGTGLTLGLSLQALTTDAMDVTTELQPFGTGETFQFSDVGVGATLSQRLTDLFSYGVTAKWIRESAAGLTTNGVVFDIGIFYRIGQTGAEMAVAVRNFGPDARPSGELERVIISGSGQTIETDFESITPPTMFLLGVTYNALRGAETSDLNISAQLNNPSDNIENWNVGAEYVWNRTLFMRVGYRFGIEEYTIPSVGAGVQVPILGPLLRFDYAFSRLDRLGDVHRVGLNLNFK